MFLPYTCNVCGRPGMVEYESELDSDLSWIANILCHNRCADFLRTKFEVRQRIELVLGWYKRMQLRSTVDGEIARDKARLHLVTHTKTFSESVCRFYEKPLAWEPFLADTILAGSPSGRVLSAFENAIRYGLSLSTLSNNIPSTES